MDREFDIAIIGAGPAGLAAAITAKEAQPHAEIVLIEKMEEPAKKLSASGNGRGNLSNKACASFSRVLQFFAEAGIAVRMDDAGRLYPYSEDAKSVSSALIKRAVDLGVVLLTDTKVNNVEACAESGFRIFVDTKNGKSEILSNSAIIAAGGKSFASYGSTGDGYVIAKKLGHHVTSLIPALTAVEVVESLDGLKGVRAKAEVKLFQKGEAVFREKGEIQFREDSISGICVMNMSSHLPAISNYAGSGENRFEDCMILIDLVPDFSSANLISFLKTKVAIKDMTAGGLLETLVRKPIAEMILRETDIEDTERAESLNAEDMLNLSNALRGFRLTPCGRKGWKEAQVTKGGVPFDEVDKETMESKLFKGLYFAGEVLDYDGPCGGYNLNNAWITGIKAGEAAAFGVEG